MSADFERIMSDPLSMAWEPGVSTSINHYRLLDAPITRYLLGMGRSLFKLPSLATDWNWSLNWDENKLAGAFPGDDLLTIGRLTIACLFPITLILLYMIGNSIQGRFTGIMMVLVLGVNSVVLLHTRRAMAEGALLFGVTLVLYTFISADKRPALSGLAIAIAFNTKQSAIALLPIGLLAVCWIPGDVQRKSSRIASNISIFTATFIVITGLLNPFLWRQPISAARAAFDERQDLLGRQIEDIKEQAPGQLLETPIQRFAVLIAQIYITPPMFSEVGNYRVDTKPAEVIYMDTPGNVIGRNMITGGLLFGLTILGIFTAIKRVIHGPSQKRRMMILYLLAGLGLVGSMILMIPLPWQRYYIPMYPLVSFYIGLGIMWIIKNSRRILSSGNILTRLTEVFSQFSPDSRVP